MGQATREAREAGWGWILAAVLAWAVQPSGPSTIYPESSLQRMRGLGVWVQIPAQPPLEEVSGSLGYSCSSTHCLCAVSIQCQGGWKGPMGEMGKRQRYPSKGRVRKRLYTSQALCWYMGPDVLFSLV